MKMHVNYTHKHFYLMLLLFIFAHVDLAFLKEMNFNTQILSYIILEHKNFVLHQIQIILDIDK